MVQGRSAFSGGDQRYLREVQYATTAKLDARSLLHRTYSTSKVSLSVFEARLIDWPTGAAVLECGCGTGTFWSNPELPRGLSLTLTDLSPGMVGAATAAARAHGFEDVDGREVDVQRLPFDDASFDIVIANHMLYHVPDPDLAVAELARVLRSEGAVLTATNGYGHIREINEVIAEVFGDEHREQLYEVFGIDSGESRLRESFGSVVWHAFDNDLVVDDPGPLVEYGLSFPPGESATTTQQAEFTAAVQRRFVNGRVRIRTRTGVFISRAARQRV